jgi:hypothetical protein
MNYQLFIDDERFPATNGWVIVRSYKSAIDWIERYGFPYFISFDHDLGLDSLTGYDIAKWIVEYDLDHDVMDEYFQFYVHSMNPIGKINIEKLLNSYLDKKFQK